MKNGFPFLTVFAALSLSLSSLPAEEEKPLSVYAGDGLSVSVFFEDEESDEIGGEASLNGAVYPFTGLWDEDGIHLEGNLIVNGKMQPFTAKAVGKEVTFVTAGKTYHLKEGANAQAVARAPSAAPAPAARPTPTAAPAPAATPTAASDIGTLSLKRVVLHDINMGGVVAHTLLIPSDWKLEGHIEWATDGSHTWQNNFKVSGPQHEQIAAIPTLTFQYTESRGGGMAPIGVPAPRELGKWIVERVKQKNQAVSEVALREDKRDPAAEAALVEKQRAMGVNAPGMTTEIHLVTITYLQDGVRMRQEIQAHKTLIPPLVNQNIWSQTWLLFTPLMISAPEADFERKRPQLLAIAGTRRMVPQWWNQMMQLRSDLLRIKAENINAEIARRGRMYDQMSDDQFAAWKRSDAQDNKTQRQRIQGIYEVQDYQDRDGSAVELPFHHKHVFSDGQGNYVLTNDYNTKPGASFEEIEAAN